MVNPNIPAGAMLLLDFIGRVETGKAGSEGYGVIYANKQGSLPKPLTGMTLDEVQTAQATWSKRNGSSAAGRYQFMRATLKELIAQLGLRGSQKFTPELQDQLGFVLLKRRGWTDFASGILPPIQFGNRLAMEWASLPVLKSTQGSKRFVERGETYYAGDGINKVLTKPETVEDVLQKALYALPAKSIPTILPGTPAPVEDDPADAIAPPPAKRGVNWWLWGALAVAATLGGVAMFVPLPI